VAVLVVCSLVAVACTDDTGTQWAEPPSGATAEFSAYGGIDQATVVDAPPDTAVTLVDGDGDEVASGATDRFGSFIFRQVTPGDDYRVVADQGEGTVRTEAFRVLAETDTPPQSLYEDQDLREGLNYLRVRDGVTLAATVRLPPGTTLEDGPFPTLIEYSGYAVAPPGDLLEALSAQLAGGEVPEDPLVPGTATVVGSLIAPVLGFAVVSLQIRGTGCSGGDFDLFGLPTVYDGYDAVETVAAQPWVKGGKVGMVGISYSGISQLFVAGTRPPSLAAIAPMSALSDLYDSVGFPGGIFNNGFAKSWLTERQQDALPAPEEGQDWAGVLIEQGDTTCERNQQLRLQTRDVLELLDENRFREPALYDRRTPIDWAERIEVPVFLVGGYQDDQLGGHWVNLVEALGDNPDVWVTMYNGNHNDALGPEVFPRWVEFLDLFVADEVPEIPELVLGLANALYGQIGSAAAPGLEQTRFAGTDDLAAARATFEQDPRIRLLMEVGAGPLGPRSLQATAELDFDEWPPAGTEPSTWTLSADGALVDAANEDAVVEGEADYVADPAARPKRSTENGGVAYSADEPYDWRPVAEGKGLGYVTAPLTEDVLIAGGGSLDLRMAASAADTDLQVTLSEVRPDGRETYLTSGWLRASRRALDESASSETYPVQTHVREDEALLSPGEFVDVRVPVNPVVTWLRAGSRLRVTVQAPGGDVPLWEFDTIDDGTTTVTVLHGPEVPSRLVLPTVPATPTVTPLPACDTLRGQPCRDFVRASNGG
jgi:predicted acyl esterase